MENIEKIIALVTQEIEDELNRELKEEELMLIREVIFNYSSL
ncbi:hypothetical protein JOD17_002511 [Geomicrobium sediminis]|uniref:Transporter n=1 Tax=Geomicrobium sediminis TaxID=1347788 RepID=A0ABS2PDR1_9BACL|nr:hypothetical protein [Geomicrobium sediminis]